MRRALAIVLAFTGVLAAASAFADAPGGKHVSFTVSAGLALPKCSGAGDSCDGSLGAGPSLGASVLYEPNGRWGFGVVGQLARVHWRGSYLGMTDGQPHEVDSDLTPGFVGLAVRYLPLSNRVVTPVIQLALGAAFQAQTASNPRCTDGRSPTSQLALGLRGRLTSSMSLFALASASGGATWSACATSDGAPATPFAGWGFGLHAGAAFDLPVGNGAASGALD
jgi:hypothetical protein